MRRPCVAILLLACLLVPTVVAEGADFQVFYSEKVARFVADGVAAEGETRGYKFVIAQQNVTRVEFELTWVETDDATGLSGDDVFALTAQDPAGRPLGAPARSATGAAALASLPVASVPRDGPVAADDLARTLDERTSTAGQGEWRAWVKLEDVGNPSGARFDEGNAFQLVAKVHYYDGTPMRVVSMERPPSSLVTAATDAPVGWLAALGGLLALAVGLGVYAWRHPRRNAEVGLSLEGATRKLPER